MMNYIYSELQKAVEKVTYEGLDSKTAAVVVDNEKNTIQVNIIDIPAELLSPNVDILGPSGRYILLATLNLNTVTYEWVTIEDFLAKLESDKEAIYTRIDNEATRTDNMIKQVNDNVSLVVENMTDGFNTINGSIDTEIQERRDADSALDSKIESEAERATQAEGSLDSRLTQEISDREQASLNIVGDAADDYNTLGKLEDKLQAEVSRAQEAETTLQTNLGEEIERAVEADAELGIRIENLEGKTTSTFTNKVKGIIQGKDADGYVSADGNTGFGKVFGFDKKVEIEQVNNAIATASIKTSQLVSDDTTELLLDAGTSTVLV